MTMTATLPGLHADHLAYLRERGITDATIGANGLHSARPQDIARLAGRSVPDGISGLVIPYPSCDGFARVRLFPPLVTADGRQPKFGQPAGSAVRLSVPHAVREALANAEDVRRLLEHGRETTEVVRGGRP